MFEAIAARQAELRGEPLRPTPPFAEWIRDKLTECRPGTEKEIAERLAAHEAAKPQVEALAAMIEDARARVAARTETTEGSG